jgi:hypothetical protein
MKSDILAFVQSHNPSTVPDVLEAMVSLRLSVPKGTAVLKADGYTVATGLPKAFADTLQATIAAGALDLRFRMPSASPGPNVHVHAQAMLHVGGEPPRLHRALAAWELEPRGMQANDLGSFPLDSNEGDARAQSFPSHRHLKTSFSFSGINR